jgi:hypothetical protein
MTDYTKLIERLNKIPVSVEDWKTVEETVAAIDALQSQLDTAIQSSAHWQHQCTELQAKLDAMGKGEAVAYIQTQKGGEVELVWDKDEELEGELYAYSPLYAAPKALAPLTDEQCRASFEAWYASAPDAEPEPERTYELTDESMTELTKDCIWLGWQAAHGIHAKGGQHEDA